MKIQLQFLSARNPQKFPGPLPPTKNGALEPFFLQSPVVSSTSILFAKPEAVVSPFFVTIFVFFLAFKSDKTLFWRHLGLF